MTDAGILLAHGGHGGGGTFWLLIPLLIVAFLLWKSGRRERNVQAPRSLGPPPKERSSSDDRVEPGEDAEPPSVTRGGET